MEILRHEGWTERQSRHGRLFTIGKGDTYRRTTVPEKHSPIPRTTLGQILGPKQTGWGRRGLIERMRKMRGARKAAPEA